MKTEWHWVRSRVTRDRFWPRACEGLIAIPSDPTSHEGLSVFMNGLKFSWGWYFVQQSHNYLGIWVRSHFPLLLCPKKIGPVSDFGDVSTTVSTCHAHCKHVFFQEKTRNFGAFLSILLEYDSFSLVLSLLLVANPLEPHLNLEEFLGESKCKKKSERNEWKEPFPSLNSTKKGWKFFPTA